MGGRGNLGSKQFKNTTKEGVLDTLNKRDIRLLKEGKLIKDPYAITHKELATLSALSEIADLKHIKAIDISSKREDKPLVAVKVNRKTANGEIVSVPTLYVSKSMSRKGYKHMNKAVGGKGIKGFSLTKKASNKKPKAKIDNGNPRTRKKTDEEKALGLLRSLGLK